MNSSGVDGYRVDARSCEMSDARTSSKANGSPQASTNSSDVGQRAPEDWIEEEDLLKWQAVGNLKVLTEETEEYFGVAGVRYLLTSLLGEGSFGSVFRCIVVEQGTGSGAVSESVCAVKVINVKKVAMMTGRSCSAVFAWVMSEVETLCRLGRHPHIVHFHKAFVSASSLRLFIVMEHLSGGDLFSEVVRRRRPFSEREARSVIKQLLDAVGHCHACQIAHRDIKLENVLLEGSDGNDETSVKLCDYGQALFLGTTEGDYRHSKEASTAKTLTTTALYTPPEVSRAVNANLPYDPFKVDAYGIGIILYGLLCNALPDAAKGKMYESHHNWSTLSPGAQDLVRQLLCPDPDQRLSVEEVQDHPWVNARPNGRDESRASTPQSVTPLEHQAELEALLAAQALNRALQRERGASCWMIASAQGRQEHRWRCQATSDRLVQAEEALGSLPKSSAWGELRSTYAKIRAECRRLQQVCHEMASPANKAGPPGPICSKCRASIMHGMIFCGKCGTRWEEDFDMIFGRYSILNEELISSIGVLLESFQAPGPPRSLEIRLRLLLLIAEQLGRERAFLAHYINRPDQLKTLQVQLRFAKIQGCRQLLLGTSNPLSQREVVSSASGLLHTMRLSSDSPLSTEEIADLEEDERLALEGTHATSDWFSRITELIDKVHKHISMGIVEFVHCFAHTRRASRQFWQTPPEAGLRGSDTAARKWSSPNTMEYGEIPRSRVMSPPTEEEEESGPAGPVKEKMVAAMSEIFRNSSPIPSSATSSCASMQYGDLSSMPRHVTLSGSTVSVPAKTPVNFPQHFDHMWHGLSSALAQVPNMPYMPPKVGQDLREVSMPTTREATPIHPSFRPLCIGYQQAARANHMLQVTQATLLCIEADPEQEVAQIHSASADEVEDVVPSMGTIGHPLNCSKVGCKFFHRPRGCKDGLACIRCHLCTWTRNTERYNGGSRAMRMSHSMQQPAQLIVGSHLVGSVVDSHVKKEYKL